MNNEGYKVIQFLHDGLVVIGSWRYGSKMWARCVVRKTKTCEISGKPLKGKKAYRPMTNGANRMHRIDAEIVEKMIEGMNKK